MTRVVVPIHARDPAGVARQAAAAAAAGADLVEVRLDLCLDAGARWDAAPALLEGLALPAVATLRHADEGGRWRGAESERRRCYEGLRATAYDVEAARFADPAWAGFRPAGDMVLSFHDFHGPGGDLPRRVRAMLAAGAAIAKVAVTAHDAHDLAAVRDVLAGSGGRVAAMAMGEAGLPSRLLAGVWGSAWTFARLDGDGAGTAPGQPTVGDLLHLYRLRQHTPRTAVYGVAGSPISHSLSPLIHNAAFAHLGVDAVYVPFLVADLPRFWAACGPGIAGLSITLPHKEALLHALDGVEPLVSAVGALNTIYRDAAGAVLGANTDAVAITACLEPLVGSLAGRTVLVLGAGGVARAAIQACRAGGARVVVANRTMSRAAALAAETGCAVVAWEAAPDVAYDVLINGTSVGMRHQGQDDPASPWPAEAHRPGTVAFDTVYIPLETTFLKDAQVAGCATLCGLDMFIAQAAGQCRRWTGREAPLPLMRRLALTRLGG
jgi:3-dehydroquinate dehydratase / shikimate dehydrogenase